MLLSARAICRKTDASPPLVYQPKLAVEFSRADGVSSRDWYGDMAGWGRLFACVGMGDTLREQPHNHFFEGLEPFLVRMHVVRSFISVSFLPRR